MRFKKFFEAKAFLMTAALALFACGFTACSSDDDGDGGGGEEKYPVYVGVDEDGNSTSELTFYDANNAQVAFVDLDDNGICKEIRHIYDENGNTAVIQFDDNGLLKTIVEDGVILSFANYEGNTVDIAVTVGDEVKLIQDFVTEANWDELLAEVSTNENNAKTRGGIILTMDEKLRELSAYIKFIDATYKKGGKEAVKEAIKGSYEGTLKSPESMKLFLDNIDKVLYKYGIEGGSGVDPDVASATVVAATDGFTFFKEICLVAGQGVLKQFYTVIKHYEEWSNFCESYFYIILEALDELAEEIDAGEGALKSGYGTLKATLSWGFYADVDLHAKEPNGTHIYYGNNISYATGGWLDVDDREGGLGSTENIYWENPEEGVYTIYINYYGPSTFNHETETGNCKVSIFCDGKGKSFNVHLGTYETAQIANVEMPNGYINGDVLVDSRTRGEIKISIPYKKKD